MPCGAGLLCAPCWAGLLCAPVGGGPPARVGCLDEPGRCVCRWAAVFLRCLLPRQISDRRAACPPASRPRRELRSARRLEARPGPAGLAAASNRSGCLCVVRPGPAAHGYRGLAPSIAQDSHPVVTSHIPEPAPSFACNSPTILSNFEIRLLELRRFQTLLKLHSIELHASFLRGGCIRCLLVS